MKRKIAIIGLGMVGTSFLYSAINKEIADEYILIDINEELTLGHKLDIEDAIPHLDKKINIKIGNYDDCLDSDIVVVTAGRPQKEGETRLNMIIDNSKIMSFIALSIKKSGFNGISIIVSNPVDCLTTVYQKVTGFSPEKVISSGCAIDSSRFKIEIAKKTGNHPKEIDANIIGEHGDSSVAIFSNIFVGGEKLDTDYFSVEEKEEIHKTVVNKAYEIINRKGATYYGIGTALVDIIDSIIHDKNKIFSVGTLYSSTDLLSPVYISFPSTLGINGSKRIENFVINYDEDKKMNKSIKVISDYIEKINIEE